MREMLTPHRVRAAALALTAAAAVALTGCGTKTQAVAPASPPIKLDAFQQRAREVVRQWPKVAAQAGHHEAVLPLAGADRPKSKAVREITVTVHHSACDAHYGARSYETGSLVVVSGWGKRKNAKGMCTELLATDKVKVKLDKPLDGRTVVDAATGKRLPLG
ncbi:hypothetical protein [Streptomyces gilvosporeus]|uniref:Lipoprotein n=1 Tax=Streptomyces gilvosporeus TaxID=553510 RepID=A0A1V0TPG9_9ACTN|nr:hypothetical protein [Streptomyces gilvosporeus]ARF54836.1 hypothetical protein B1H19_11995 [Streptomyces gilvosporeus]